MATAKKTATNDAFEAITSMTPEFFKGGYEKFADNMTALVDFQKSSMEALMTSAGAFAKGMEKIATENAAFAKEAFEESVSAAKAAAASKSVQEALDHQNDFVRQAFEKNLHQFNKSAEQMISVTKESTQPLTTQYGAFVEKVQSFRP